MTTELDTTFIPTLEAVEEAREIVARTTRPTLLDSANFLTEYVGSPVHVKCENMQRTGSYKIRGATNRLAKLSPAERERGVVAASAGNHAQGVAYAARELGIAATIYMPLGVPIPKLEATRNYGADVVLHGATFNETLAAAQAFCDETGATFIHPYNHPDVITGQATLGAEILEQLPEVETVIVPIGGGGLAAGVASMVKQTAEREGRRIRVIGVQSANSAAFVDSIKAGRPVKIDAKPTIADGIAVNEPGSLTFELVRRYVDEIVTVSDDDIARAILLLLERGKLLVEPAGATPIAAMLAGQIRDTGTTAAILSGGNIDPMMLEKVISQGLTASSRYMRIIINLRDVPGHLARIATILADINANVIEVMHTRHNKGLQITHVELEISVETRGEDHAHLVLDALRAAGYEPRIDRDATL